MMKLIFILCFISLPLYAQITTSPPEVQTLTSELEKVYQPFEAHESHWLFSFGFEGLKYETDYNFSGTRKNLQPRDVELWGGRIGIGGEIYLGAGIMTATKFESYYNGTLFARRLNAGPDNVDIEFAYTKTTGQVVGFEASQSLSWLYDFKTKNPFMDEWAHLTLEPFIEAGIGAAWAYNRVQYNFDIDGSTSEGYKKSIEDELTNVRFGGGVNLISGEGVFLYVKAHVNNFDIAKRRTEEYTRPDGQPWEASVKESRNGDTIDPIITYAVGGGYKF
jgi:hypothetical protein